MREFAARVFPMRHRMSLAAAVLLAGCHSAEYELYLEQVHSQDLEPLL